MNPQLIADLRETNNQYVDNDLKYRYVKMNRQTNEDSFTRLEHQFKYSDNTKIIRKQVEKYEELVKELNSFNASYLYSYSGRHKCS